MPVRVAGGGSGGRLRKVPGGSGGRFRELPVCAGVGSGACRRRFRRQGSEGSGEIRCGLLPCKLDRSSHVIVF